MSELSFRKSANIDRVTDKRKDSLFRLVDTDGSGTIDAQEFAVLYDAIKKDLAEELEKEAALEKEASSARRRLKMLLLFVAVLISFLAASVAANFAVIFTVIDQAITTTTTSSGLLEVKGSDAIAKTAIATQDVPLLAAPVLDLETLSNVKSLKVTYGYDRVQAHMSVVAVRKHNSTFVEFVTDVPGETVQTLNGVASLVIYPTSANRRTEVGKYEICAANATCSAFKSSGVDAEAAVELAKTELKAIGAHDAARRLDPAFEASSCWSGSWQTTNCAGSGSNACGTDIDEGRIVYYDAYSGQRHVVFFLPGLGKRHLHMWNYYCTYQTTGPGSCPALMIDEFRHLVFVFVTSGHRYVGQRSWCTDLFDPLTYENGAQAISGMKCGFNSDPTLAFSVCPATSGYLNTFTYGTGNSQTLGIDSTSEAMIFGFSNGGAAANYISVVHGGHYVTKAVAVDYHAWHGPSWLDDSRATFTGFKLKIYYSCAAQWYKTRIISDGSRQMPVLAGLTTQSYPNSPTITYPTYGPIPSYWWTPSYTGVTYREFTWTHPNAPADDRYLIFAVHGMDTDDLSQSENSGNNGNCDSNSIPGSSGSDIHMNVPEYVDVQGDILEWVSMALPPPSLPPAPPVGSPPVDSPPPPSSPPPPPPPSPSPPSPAGGGPTGGGPILCDGKKWCCPPMDGKRNYICLKGGECYEPFSGYHAKPIPCGKKNKKPMDEDVPCEAPEPRNEKEVWDLESMPGCAKMFQDYAILLQPMKLPYEEPGHCNFETFCSLVMKDYHAAKVFAAECRARWNPHTCPRF